MPGRSGCTTPWSVFLSDSRPRLSSSSSDALTFRGGWPGAAVVAGRGGGGGAGGGAVVPARLTPPLAEGRMVVESESVTGAWVRCVGAGVAVGVVGEVGALRAVGVVG